MADTHRDIITPHARLLMQLRDDVKTVSRRREKGLQPSEKKDGMLPLLHREGISICLTAWQTQDYIEECLDSIEAQTYFKGFNGYEILLGIDGCEQTLEKVKQIQYKYRNLRVFMMYKNVGTYITTNTVMKMARYDWLLRFDTDDVMMPDMVERLMKGKKDGVLIRYKYCNFTTVKEHTHEDFAYGSMMVKKSVFAQYGGYRPWVCAADYDLWCRLNGTVKTALVGDAKYWRRFRNDSLEHREETSMKSKIRAEYHEFIREKTKSEKVIECVTAPYKELPTYYAVIGITTWRKRIGTVHKTLETLTKDRHFKVVLTLSEEEFPQKERELPESVTKYVESGKVEILWVYRNTKSFKKVLYVMEKYKNKPVISADDDSLYVDSYAMDLYEAYLAEPQAIHYNSPGTGSGLGWIWPPYCYGEFTTAFIDTLNEEWSNDDVLYLELARALDIPMKCLNNRDVAKIHDNNDPIDMLSKYNIKGYKQRERAFYKETIHNGIAKLRGLNSDATARYRGRFHRDIDILHPKTISEKLLWCMLYDGKDRLKTLCADKIKVHEYARKMLGKDICVPIIKVYGSPAQIKLDELPDKFVLKCNHGYAYNIICRDKASLDLGKSVQSLTAWLNTPFGKESIEPHYLNIERKCYAETFLENKGQQELTDYKFICFNGEPTYCQILNGRHTKDFHANYYDMDFNFVDLSRKDVRNRADLLDNKPQGFETMKEYARSLSKEFKFVRVDFYEVDGVVYLGELTFTPATCFIHYEKPSDDIRIGNILKL